MLQSHVNPIFYHEPVWIKPTFAVSVRLVMTPRVGLELSVHRSFAGYHIPSAGIGSCAPAWPHRKRLPIWSDPSPLDPFRLNAPERRYIIEGSERIPHKRNGCVERDIFHFLCHVSGAWIDNNVGVGYCAAGAARIDGGSPGSRT